MPSLTSKNSKLGGGGGLSSGSKQSPFQWEVPPVLLGSRTAHTMYRHHCDGVWTCPRWHAEHICNSSQTRGLHSSHVECGPKEAFHAPKPRMDLCSTQNEMRELAVTTLHCATPCDRVDGSVGVVELLLGWDACPSYPSSNDRTPITRVAGNDCGQEATLDVAIDNLAQEVL